MLIQQFFRESERISTKEVNIALRFDISAMRLYDCKSRCIDKNFIASAMAVMMAQTRERLKENEIIKVKYSSVIYVLKVFEM